MDNQIVQALKNFDWQNIIERGNGLEDLNDRQWRFAKGLAAELIVEKYSGENGLKYVGQDHKDYDWPSTGLTVELKSGLSGSMYGKKGNLCKRYSVKFNNSNGTNKKDQLNSNEVADILLVVKNDGAFAVDKETVIRCSKKGGDGFEVILTQNDIIPLTDKIVIDNAKSFNMKERLMNAIRTVI